MSRFHILRPRPPRAPAPAVPGRRRPAPQPILQRFLRETRSDTAVEFAMIGSTFFLFIFAIFVIATDQFWQMTLDDAVRNAARQVAIGKVTATSSPAFTNVVCQEFGLAAPNCAGSLQYSVVGGTSFAAMSPASLSASGQLTGPGVSTPFTGVSPTTQPMSATSTSDSVPGIPQYVLVQVAYPLPFKIFMVPGGVATGNGTSSLYSAAAMAMEP